MEKINQVTYYEDSKKITVKLVNQGKSVEIKTYRKMQIKMNGKNSC